MQRYNGFNNCDYEGYVGGIVNCCDGIQGQLQMSGALVERTIKSGYQMRCFRLDFSYEIEVNIDAKGVVLPSFDNLGICGAYLRYFLPRNFGTSFPRNHLSGSCIDWVPR